MSRKFITTLALILSVSIVSQAQSSADKILTDAYQQAARENKNVFVIFHASWCGWCHKMDTSIADPVCNKFFTDNYVITHLVVQESKGKQNLENPGALELLTKYKGVDLGIPYWLVLDKDGNLLADSRILPENGASGPEENCGCPAKEEEVTFFTNILKRTSKMTAQQLEIIRKRFRQNAD